MVKTKLVYPTKVANRLLEVPKKEECLDPKAKEYSVADMEKGYLCRDEEVEDLRDQLKELSTAVRARQRT